MSEDLKKEALVHLSGDSSVMLATVDAEGPHVRPVTLIEFDNAYWIETGTTSAKIRQIRDNPKVELCLVFTDDTHNGYIRLSGSAKIVTDGTIRERVSSHTEFFADYWNGPDDPNFTLLRIMPTEVEYMRPKKMESHKFAF
ncbi:MAG: pyridoxamine 5'-phosphate oxidase family protein [Candidatus Bipolaricaulota bacterium]|nr:pyridoxamine 5'-phosphate oxidase family protein [Candidatus Bipolaricaulota bacterium]